MIRVCVECSFHFTTCLHSVQKSTRLPHFGQRTVANGKGCGGGHGSTIVPGGRKCRVTSAWQRGQGLVIKEFFVSVHFLSI